MSMQDTISDMITRLRNGGMASLREVSMPASRMKLAIANVLKEEGYVIDCREENEGASKSLIIKLKYHKRKHVIEGIKRISRPSCRIYCNSREIPKVRNGFGIVVLSTPNGVMSGRKAVSQNVGGELLFSAW